MQLRTPVLAALAASCVILLGCGQSSRSPKLRAWQPASAAATSARGAAAVALSATSDLNSGSAELMGRNDRLSVMSFNMHHRDRPNELRALADDLRIRTDEIPDFILLQEVVFGRSKRKGEDSTAGALANELGYYSRGTKRSSDREGLAIISRYPFTYYASLEHQAQTSRLLFGFNRVSVMAEFRVPEIGKVRIVNVHYTNWGFEEHVRRQQLRETLTWIAQRQRELPADVIVLGGDFNIEPSWDEFGLMSDVEATHGITYRDYNNPAAATFGSKGNADKRVDYIFIATPGRDADLAHLTERCLWPDGVVTEGNRRFFPSDHLPVVHEYLVRGVTSGAAVRAALAD